MAMETLEEAPAKKTSPIEEIAKLREDLNNGLQHCREEIELMKTMQNTPPGIAVDVVATQEERVEMLATGQLLCPKCNLMLEGFSATGERTLRFSHPFSQSPKLGGKQCEYTGWTFSPPRIDLKVVSKPAKRS